MFTRKMRLMEEAGEGEGGSGATIEELTAQLAEANKNIDGLKHKADELLGETKKAKKLKLDAEALAQKQADEKAKASGDHEQLLRSSESQREKLQSDYDHLINSNNHEKISNAALKIANELADGFNAELLSESISKRLKISDGVLKVTDENGELTVSPLSDLKTFFKNNERYASLLKGNQSSGGGAAGGSNSGGAAKVKTRAEFEALNPADQMKFMREGGTTQN